MSGDERSEKLVAILDAEISRRSLKLSPLEQAALGNLIISATKALNDNGESPEADRVGAAVVTLVNAIEDERNTRYLNPPNVGAYLGSIKRAICPLFPFC